MKILENMYSLFYVVHKILYIPSIPNDICIIWYTYNGVVYMLPLKH